MDVKFGHGDLPQGATYTNVEPTEINWKALIDLTKEWWRTQGSDGHVEIDVTAPKQIPLPLKVRRKWNGKKRGKWDDGEVKFLLENYIPRKHGHRKWLARRLKRTEGSVSFMIDVLRNQGKIKSLQKPVT